MDLIERQTAIDAHCELCPDKGKCNHVDLCPDVEVFYLLQSVQPEPRNKNNAEVISILSDMRSRYNCFDPEDEEYYRGLSEAIKALSAQPEIIRCKDCKYSDENWRRVSVRWLPCMDMRTGSNWFCGSAERRTDDEG